MAARTIAHRASATTRTTLALYSFMAFSFLVGGVIAVAGIVASPHTLVVDCQREGACQMTPIWPWLGPRVFPVSRIADLVALETSHGDMLVAARRSDGRFDHWTPEVHGDANTTAVEAAVDALHAWADADAPSMHVEIPSAAPISPFAFVFVVLWGAWLVSRVGRFTVRTDVVLDDDARELRLVLHHWWRPNVRRTIPYASAKGIARIHTMSRYRRYRFVSVFVRVEGEPKPLLVLHEYLTPKVDTETAALAHAMSESMGVPISDR